MGSDGILGHGGTGGAFAEAAILLVPVVAFFVLSWWSKRRDRAEADAAAPPQAGTDGEP